MALRSAESTKAAYHSFQLMTGLLGEVDWSAATLARPGEEQLVFELPGADGRSRWVAWIDDEGVDGSTVSLTVGDQSMVRVFQTVPQNTAPGNEGQGTFVSQELPVEAGQVQLSIGATPKLVTPLP